MDAFLDGIDANDYGLSNVQGYVDGISVESHTGGSGVDLALNGDGTKLYVFTGQGDVIQSYSLSPAYDLASASATNTLDVNSRDGIGEGIDFGDSGAKFYFVGENNDNIYEYNLSTDYDISTASFNQSADISGQTTTPDGLAIADSGNKAYVTSDDTVIQWNLSTQWDISTISHKRTVTLAGNYNNNEGGFAFADGGSTYFVITDAGASLLSFALSTNWDLSTRAIAEAYPLVYTSNEGEVPRAVTYIPSEDSFFLLSETAGADETVWQFRRNV